MDYLIDGGRALRGSGPVGSGLSIGYVNVPAAHLAARGSDPHNALVAHGVHRLFIDVDDASTNMTQLDCAIAEIQPGDVLVSASLETLTRSISGLLSIYHRLRARGGSLLVLQLMPGLKLDTSLPEGHVILSAVAVMNLLPAPAQVPPPQESPWNAPARQTPARPRGRPATAVSQAHEITRLRAQGLKAVDIAASLGIGRASVYRILSQKTGEPSGNSSDST